MPGRAVGAKAAAASGLGPVPASWSLCSVSGGTLRNTKCARSGGNPGLQEPISIGSCVLFLCSVIERVRRWPEHWKPVPTDAVTGNQKNPKLQLLYFQPGENGLRVYLHIFPLLIGRE